MALAFFRRTSNAGDISMGLQAKDLLHFTTNANRQKIKITVPSVLIRSGKNKVSSKSIASSFNANAKNTDSRKP